MSDQKPISLAFYEAVRAVRNTIGVEPLPKGINKAEISDWELTLNTSSEELENVQPFTVKAVHKKYFCFAIFDPTGGCCSGGAEDKFIADMQAFNAELEDA